MERVAVDLDDLAVFPERLDPGLIVEGVPVRAAVGDHVHMRVFRHVAPGPCVRLRVGRLVDGEVDAGQHYLDAFADAVGGQVEVSVCVEHIGFNARHQPDPVHKLGQVVQRVEVPQVRRVGQGGAVVCHAQAFQPDFFWRRRRFPQSVL